MNGRWGYMKESVFCVRKDVDKMYDIQSFFVCIIRIRMLPEDNEDHIYHQKQKV